MNDITGTIDLIGRFIDAWNETGPVGILNAVPVQ
jgi:hypothetical protein